MIEEQEHTSPHAGYLQDEHQARLDKVLKQMMKAIDGLDDVINDEHVRGIPEDLLIAARIETRRARGKVEAALRGDIRMVGTSPAGRTPGQGR